MKYYLILILFALFVVVAIIVYIFYQTRHKLFKDLIFIIKMLKNDISFNKNDINTILNKCAESISPSTIYLLKNHDEKSKKLFLKGDYAKIKEFFSSLGRGNVDFEINNLNYYENIFATIESEAKENVAKKGMLYLKLIIGFGLIVCVMML